MSWSTTATATTSAIPRSGAVQSEARGVSRDEKKLRARVLSLPIKFILETAVLDDGRVLLRGRAAA